MSRDRKRCRLRVLCNSRSPLNSLPLSFSGSRMVQSRCYTSPMGIPNVAPSERSLTSAGYISRVHKSAKLHVTYACNNRFTWTSGSLSSVHAARGSSSRRGGRRRRSYTGGSSIDRTILPPSIDREVEYRDGAKLLRAAKRTGLPPRVRMVAGCCQGAVVPTKEAPTLAAPWTRTAAPGPSSSSMHRAPSRWWSAGVVMPTVPRFKHAAPLKGPQGRDNVAVVTIRDWQWSWVSSFP